MAIKGIGWVLQQLQATADAVRKLLNLCIHSDQ